MMKRYFKEILLIATILALPCMSDAASRTAGLPEVAGLLKTAEPGDTIFVSAGIFSDMELKWEGRGTAEAPVVVIAESAGKTVITGTSTLKIFGHDLVVSSFLFKDGKPVRNNGPLVEFRNGDRLATGCRLTECVIDSYNAPRRDYQSSYVHLYGRNNRVDHCSFTGKKSLGVTLTVLLNYDGCLDNHHRIDHNWFGYRPVYGSNGAETIRVGTSQQCMEPSRTEITDNVFYRCNGEVEVISIKSCENNVSRNVLYECEGVLAFRHGDRNVAEDNMFIGNGRRNTGGIRIVGAGQTVRGNLFHGCAGDRFFSALALMNAVPNSLPNRYMQVQDILIEDNDFVDCNSIEFGTGCDFERTLAPDDILFRSNRIYNRSLTAPYEVFSDASGLTFKSNKAMLADGTSLPSGFSRASGKDIPAAPGIDEVKAGVGASWYEDKTAGEPTASTVRTVEAASDADLAGIVAAAGDGTRVVLTDSLYLIGHGMTVSSRMEICAAEGVKPEIRFVGKKSENMITIADGADLTVSGITFNGVLTSGKSLAKAAISTAEDMIEPYNLKVIGCTFVNYGESGFIPVKGTAGTFADTVLVKGCHFEALSGDGINYAAELGDKGRYNADDIIIEDCTFERILGLPVNIARNGSDESTAGPYVYVRNCRFNDCCNKVRGSVIRIIGAQILDIEGCSFIDSGRGGYSIRLDDAPWEKITVGNLSFENSGGIMSNRKFDL